MKNIFKCLKRIIPQKNRLSLRVTTRKSGVRITLKPMKTPTLIFPFRRITDTPYRAIISAALLSPPPSMTIPLVSNPHRRKKVKKMTLLIMKNPFMMNRMITMMVMIIMMITTMIMMIMTPKNKKRGFSSLFSFGKNTCES